MNTSIQPVDELYMYRCMQLARNAGGSTSPNPMVGAVIVCDNRVIGEGYHIRAGEPHAEVNAVRSVKECDKHLLKESTIYVSLEPCSHYGKTPPCCDLIISCGIPRVVIGITDVNAQVNGEGILRMQRAGIDVTIGVLRDKAFELNRKFFTLHKEARPYITLKWAQTADGFIGRNVDMAEEHTSLRISTPGSMMAVHKLRALNDAILVGTRTALIDNPSLTVRHWCGKNPLRLVIDRKGVLPSTLNLFNDEAQTIVYTNNVVEGKFNGNVQQVQLPSEADTLVFILAHLASLKVNSLLVEGGAALHSSFIDADLWDEIRVECNENLVIGDGVKAPALPQKAVLTVASLFNNKIMHFVR